MRYQGWYRKDANYAALRGQPRILQIVKTLFQMGTTVNSELPKKLLVRVA
jgi:hypothetical protein